MVEPIRISIGDRMPRKQEIFLQVLLACFIRFSLMTSKYQEMLSDRIEISTPLNSWKRVTEGVYLLNNNMNPYLGDQFHEPPHNLYIYKYIINYNNEDSMPFFFITCDVLTSILLFITARKYIRKAYQDQTNLFLLHDAEIIARSRSGSGEAANSSELEDTRRRRNRSAIILKPINLQQFPLYCAIVYLFNPFVIMNCVAQTTTVFSNLTYAGLLYALVFENYLLSVCLVSFGAAQSLYPLTLLSAVILKFCSKDNVKYNFLIGIGIVIHVAFNLLGLSLLSRYLSGSWSFMNNVYMFVLNIGDLRPNIGLFWYFFTEMFEHFHDLFIAVFQINIFILYIIPLSIRFRKDPIFLCVNLMILGTIFKAYPSLGDVGFYICVLPMWFNLLRYLQQAFLVTTIFLITIILGPIVWHLWIVTGTANANFYFGVTLGFAAAQIFLVTDFLFSYVKREFWLKNRCRGITEEQAVGLVLE